jgi:hypothetical protein
MIDYERAEREAQRLLLSIRSHHQDERLFGCCVTRILATLALLEFLVILAGAAVAL